MRREAEKVASRGDVVGDVAGKGARKLREDTTLEPRVARHAQLDPLLGHGGLDERRRRWTCAVPARDPALQREVGGDERGRDGQPAMRSPAATCSAKICSIVAPSAWRAI